jgi:hypothetical protein
MVPMWWVEKLRRCRIGDANCETPRATGTAHQVALHLLHLHWSVTASHSSCPTACWNTTALAGDRNGGRYRIWSGAG